jgi:hypothetical protein
MRGNNQMNRKKLGARLGVLAVTGALVLAVAGLSVAPASAHGCTPGFWKNRGFDLHIDNTALETVTLDDVFNGFDSSIEDDTLVTALSYGGGSGLVNAQKILARAAAAAYFNVVVTQDYPVQLGGLQTMVNTALASNDRGTILFVAADIDFWNNIGNPAFC